MVLNINRGHNLELMKRCQRLWEYAEFIGEIRQNLKKGMELREATDKAAEYCLEHEILKDILNRCRVEVLELILDEYDEQAHAEQLRKEGREQGIKQGVHAMVELCQELGLSPEETKEKIMQKFSLDEGAAAVYLESKK